MSDQFKPVAYIKEGCPYSMKLLDFLTEAELKDRVDVVRCAAGTPTMEAVKESCRPQRGSRRNFLLSK